MKGRKQLTVIISSDRNIATRALSNKEGDLSIYVPMIADRGNTVLTNWVHLYCLKREILAKLASIPELEPPEHNTGKCGAFLVRKEKEDVVALLREVLECDIIESVLARDDEYAPDDETPGSAIDAVS